MVNLLLDGFGMRWSLSAELSGTGLCSAGRGLGAGITGPRTAIKAAKLLAALAVLGLWAVPLEAAELAAKDAARHVGETATICDTVASGKFDTNLQSQPTFLDFGEPYPDQLFTAVIFGGDRAKFGTPETALRGKRVCVTGKIQEKRGIPEIILADPKQLTE